MTFLLISNPSTSAKSQFVSGTSGINALPRDQLLSLNPHCYWCICIELGKMLNPSFATGLSLKAMEPMFSLCQLPKLP